MNQIPKIQPRLDSELTSLIFQLERLRNRNLSASTEPWLFFDLKETMHIVESIASARFEGNRTTLVSAVNDVINKERKTKSENLKELRNIRKAIEFIEGCIREVEITTSFIRELHKIVTEGLDPKLGGSKTPGKFRRENVEISETDLKLPDFNDVPELSNDLAVYIGHKSDLQFDIIKTAIAHHRFTAIHPFDDGNGRTARLLTYAMLSKQQFIDEDGLRLLNPSAIFGLDKDTYVDMLSLADTGKVANVEKWCRYVARGIQAEVERIDKLMDKDFAVKSIITPALKQAMDDGMITENEYRVAKVAMAKGIFQASDIKPMFGIDASAGVKTSRLLRAMREKDLIMVHPKYKKKYVIRFANNYLLGGVLKKMSEAGLLPLKYDE